MRNKSLLIAMATMFAYASQAQTVTDFDGNEYNTVTIGTQVWMKENLKTLHYADGSPITGVYAYGNQESNVATYGRLYTWDASMYNNPQPTAQGVCPTGWHMPTVAEYDVLLNFLGGASVAGGKMKEAGTAHWIAPNTGATDESGFTALPGGFYFNPSIGFMKMGEYGKFWTSTPVNGSSTQAYNVSLKHSEVNASNMSGNERSLGASVRCIQGQGIVGINTNKNESTLCFYPNPASELLTVNTTSQGMFSVFDLTGRIALQQNIENENNIIDISTLPTGIYLVRFETGLTIEQQKLIVE